MKNLLSILLLATVMVFSANYAHAQCLPEAEEPCLPDCPQSLFSAYQTIQVTIQPGCVLEVTYASRIACGIWYDYYISNVRILQYGCCPFLASDVATILDLATIALMDANPAGFPPSTPSSGQNCSVNWRANKGACWQQIGDCLVPCTPMTDCCLAAFEVCVDANGNKTITKLGNISNPPAPCPTTGDGDCVDVCNN